MRLGNYEWNPETDRIAEGAFAEVFRARDTNTAGRTVALKIYKEAVAKGTSGSSGQKKYTLEKEFRNVDGLSHTNVITYHGLDYIRHLDAMGRESSYPVLVMEYAEGGTLTDFLETGPDGATLGKLVLDIIHGIGYLHGEGILHRDLKPGNILIAKNRRGEPVAKITDFGISRDILTDSTLEQSFTSGVGTPHYMAPEQFYKKMYGLNGELSERTDIWALGVIVYRMATGRLPFGYGKKDYEEVRDEIVQGEPDMRWMPETYRQLVNHCLGKYASDRSGNTSELLKLIDGESLDIENEGRKDGNIATVVFARDSTTIDDTSATIQYDEKAKVAEKLEPIDGPGGVAIPIKYDRIWPFWEGLALVRLADKWGFIDKLGGEVVPVKYDDAFRFSEGLAVVKLGSKWGFVDKSGREAIQIKYDRTWSFSEGLALVKLDGKVGFVDKMGREAIAIQYDDAWHFSEGLAVVKYDGKSGYVDKSGREVSALNNTNGAGFAISNQL